AARPPEACASGRRLSRADEHDLDEHRVSHDSDPGDRIEWDAGTEHEQIMGCEKDDGRQYADEPGKLVGYAEHRWRSGQTLDERRDQQSGFVRTDPPVCHLVHVPTAD